MGFLSWSAGYSYCLHCDGSLCQLPHRFPTVDIYSSYPTLPILPSLDLCSWLRFWLVIDYVFSWAKILMVGYYISCMKKLELLLLIRCACLVVYNAFLILVRHGLLSEGVWSWHSIGNFCSCITIVIQVWFILVKSLVTQLVDTFFLI